jgi:hypothetical protein
MIDCVPVCRASWIIALSLLVPLLGCGLGGSSNEFEETQAARANVAQTLKDQGITAEEKSFPQGKAWAVDLSGKTISEEMLRQVDELGNICELNLSKSTFGDEHMKVFNELAMGVVALKLDFSGTALTDAGFKQLDNLRFLSEMDLSGTKVTAAAVKEFKTKRQSDQRVLPMFKNPKIKTG